MGGSGNPVQFLVECFLKFLNKKQKIFLGLSLPNRDIFSSVSDPDFKSPDPSIYKLM